jgi:haloacetate dehalogenase
MLLESAHDDLDIHGDPVAIWEPWLSSSLRHVVVGSGHHQAEQAPDEVARAIAEFVGAPAHRGSAP